jgi:hypothetical protein
MSTTWEHLEGAALSLARSGPIKDRLTDAYRNHLAQVSADELPESLRAGFRACHETLTREPPLLRGEDAVRATVRKMSSHEADEVARSVVRLFAASVREAAREDARAGLRAVVHETQQAAAEEAHDEAPVMSERLLNGAAVSAARHKMIKAVPQVIAGCAAEA